MGYSCLNDRHGQKPIGQIPHPQPSKASSTQFKKKSHSMELSSLFTNLNEDFRFKFILKH